MAMTFSTGTIPSVFSAAAAVTTQAITIPADAKVLFVGVNGDAASNGGAAAPTYCRLGSSEMTLAGTAPASANGQYLWLYRLDNPVPGSYNITCVHPTVQIILQSVCVAGTIPYDLVIGAGTAANTATPSSTASSTAVGGKVIHFAGFNNVMIADVTETGTKTIIAKSNGADASFGVFGAYVQDSAAGSTTATWTTSTANRFSAITIYLQEKLRYVTSFNNSLAVTPGQKSIAVTAGGFTALPAVTATYTGGTLNCTNVTGTSTSFTFDIDSRANGLAYPKVGDNITFTLTNGAESISYVSTLGLTAVETSVTFALASVANERNLGYHLAMDGYTVDGGEFIYKPYSNLAINAGGLVSVKKAGVINGWFRPSTGQGAGNVYSYSFNIPATNNYFLSLTTRTELPYTLANSWSNVLSLDTYAPVPSGATHVLIETFMPSNTTSCTYGFQNGEDYTNYVYSSVTRISRYDWISLNTAKTLKLFCNSLGNMKFYVRAYTNYIKNLPTSVDLSSQVTSSNQTTVYCNSLPADAAGGAAIIINYKGQGWFTNPVQWNGNVLDYRSAQQEVVPLDENLSFQYKQSNGALAANQIVLVGYIPAGRFVPNASLAIEAMTAISTWQDTVAQTSPEKVLDIYRFRGNSTSNLFGYATGGDTTQTTNLIASTNPIYIVPNATTGAVSFWVGTSFANAASYRVGGFKASYVDKIIGTTDTVAPGTTNNILHANGLASLTSLTIAGVLANSYVGQDGYFTFRMPRRANGQYYPPYGPCTLVATNGVATLTGNVTLVPRLTETAVTIASISNATEGYLKYYLPTLAVGDVVCFSTPTVLGVTINAIGTDGLITTDFVGTQVLWVRAAASGIMTKFTITTDSLGITPDIFVLPRQNNVALNTAIISDTITVSGLTGAAAVSITGGMYSKNGGTYDNSNGSVVNGDTISVRVTSATTALTAVDATLTIGSLTDTFTAVTTASVGTITTPNAFTFNNLINLPLNTPVTSTAITVTGVSTHTDVPISITGGTYSKNNGPFVSASGVVRLGDTVVVKVTTSSLFNTGSTATLNIGGVTGTFTATTPVVTQNVNLSGWFSNALSPKFDGGFINGGH